MYILEQLSAMFPGHEIQLMYDVACVLVKHIQVRFLKIVPIAIRIRPHYVVHAG